MRKHKKPPWTSKSKAGCDQWLVAVPYTHYARGDQQVWSQDVRYEDEAKTEVADRVATVNGYEIFIVLAVFCKGEVDDQLSFVFELFDTDKSKEMDQVDCVPCPYAATHMRLTNLLTWVVRQDEMLALLRDLTSACWKVGLTKRPPDDDELQKLTANMFAVAVRCN